MYVQTRRYRKKPLPNLPLQYITYIQYAKKVTIIKVELRAIEEVVYWFLWQFGLNCIYTQRGFDGQQGSTSRRALRTSQGNRRQRLTFLVVEKYPGQAYQIQLLPLKLTISVVSRIDEYNGEFSRLSVYTIQTDTLVVNAGPTYSRSLLLSGLDYQSDSTSKVRSKEGGFIVVNRQAIQTTEAIVLVDNFQDSRVLRLPRDLN